MEEDDWKKLSPEDKCLHKNWKARVEGYEELDKKLLFLDEENQFSIFSDIIKKIPIDSNVAAQEKGMSVVLTFVQNAPSVSGRIVNEVVSSIIVKVFGGKPKVRQLGFDTCLQFIENEKTDAVLEELVKGFDNKTPKIVSSAIEVVSQSLKFFGAKTVNIRSIVKCLPKLLDNSDKTIREQAKLLTLECYRWLRDAIRVELSSIKPVLLKELEDEFAKSDPKPPCPERYTISNKDKAVKSKEIQDGNTKTEVNEQITDVEAFDPYDLIEEVDVVSKIPSDFYEKIVSTKWQERKEALESLEKLTSLPKIKDANFNELLSVLKKVISKDANVVVVGLAVKCVGGLSNGRRAAFNSYSANILSSLFEKFKEKKVSVVTPLQEAIDSIGQWCGIQLIIENSLVFFEDKNPTIREETLKSIHRIVKKLKSSQITKPLLKQITTEVIKKLDDTSGPVRDASADILGYLTHLIGEKMMNPFIDSLDDIKKSKIKESCSKQKGEQKLNPTTQDLSNVEIKSESLKPADNVKAIEKSPSKSTTKPAVVKNEASKTNHSIPTKSDKNSQNQVSDKQKSSDSYALDREEPTESDITDEIAESACIELFGDENKSLLFSSNWKDRLTATENMIQIIQMKNSLDTLIGHQIVRYLSIKPGLKDSNFQALKGRFQTINASILKSKSFSRKAAIIVIEASVDKVTDPKIKDVARDSLYNLSEVISLNFVIFRLSKVCSSLKNHKNICESILWMIDSIKDFGPKIDIKSLLQFTKSILQNLNQEVKKSAITLIGVLQMYIGPSIKTFFDDEKPGILSQIETELEKTKNEKPPIPTKGIDLTIISGPDPIENNDKQESYSPSVSIQDLIDRLDISDKINDDIISSLNDKNWKIRNETLEKITDIISSAKFIKSNIGPLAEALKMRLNDNNKILVTSTLNLCKLIATSGGKGMVMHKTIFLSAIISTMTDSKPQLRTVANETLSVWINEIGFKEILDGDSPILLESMKIENSFLRLEMLTWLESFLPKQKSLPGELGGVVVQSIMNCSSDKNGDVRKKVQSLIPTLVEKVNVELLNRIVNSMDNSVKNVLLPLIKKAVEDFKLSKASNVNSTVKLDIETPKINMPKEEPLASSTREQKPVNKLSLIDEKKAKVVEEKTKDAKEVDTNNRKSISKALSQTNLNQQNASHNDPQASTILIIHKKGSKIQRMKDDSIGKIPKWNFSAPKSEHQKYLSEEINIYFNSTISNNLFNGDFKNQIVALKTIQTIAESNEELECKALNECFDLILKWAAIRMYDNNPSLHMKIFECIEQIVNMMSKNNFDLTEYEANCFISHLLPKLGENKDIVRKGGKNLLRKFYEIYQVNKILPIYILALESKNAKVRSECLEEILYCLLNFGYEWFNLKQLQLITKLISDRDSSVRNGCINIIVFFYQIHSEDVYKYTGKIEKKDKDIINERIKRLPKSSATINKTANEIKTLTDNNNLNKTTTVECKSELESSSFNASALNENNNELILSNTIPLGTENESINSLTQPLTPEKSVPNVDTHKYTLNLAEINYDPKTLLIKDESNVEIDASYLNDLIKVYKPQSKLLSNDDNAMDALFSIKLINNFEVFLTESNHLFKTIEQRLDFLNFLYYYISLTEFSKIELIINDFCRSICDQLIYLSEMTKFEDIHRLIDLLKLIKKCLNAILSRSDIIAELSYSSVEMLLNFQIIFLTSDFIKINDHSNNNNISALINHTVAHLLSRVAPEKSLKSMVNLIERFASSTNKQNLAMILKCLNRLAKTINSVSDAKTIISDVEFVEKSGYFYLDNEFKCSIMESITILKSKLMDNVWLEDNKLKPLNLNCNDMVTSYNFNDNSNSEEDGQRVKIFFKSILPQYIFTLKPEDFSVKPDHVELIKDLKRMDDLKQQFNSDLVDIFLKKKFNKIKCDLVNEDISYSKCFDHFQINSCDIRRNSEKSSELIQVVESLNDVSLNEKNESIGEIDLGNIMKRLGKLNKS